MAFRAATPASGATESDVSLSLQALAIMPIVGAIVGIFVVVGFAAATIGAFAAVANHRGLNRIDTTHRRCPWR
jgi:hypothetical protein